MTPTEAAALREQHAREEDEGWWCKYDGYRYPCDTIRALDYAAEQRKVAERLADAAYTFAVAYHVNTDEPYHEGPFSSCRQDYCGDAHEVLAAYTETEDRER